MNIVLLNGRLTRDPEIRESATGMKVARYSLANKVTKDKTEFFNVVAFNKSAEFASKWLKKGMLINVQGHLINSSYEKDGQTIKKMDIVADTQEFGESKKAETPEAKKHDPYEVPESWTDEGLPF